MKLWMRLCIFSYKYMYNVELHINGADVFILQKKQNLCSIVANIMAVFSLGICERERQSGADVWVRACVLAILVPWFFAMTNILRIVEIFGNIGHRVESETKICAFFQRYACVRHNKIHFINFKYLMMTSRSGRNVSANSYYDLSFIYMLSQKRSWS